MNRKFIKPELELVKDNDRIWPYLAIVAILSIIGIITVIGWAIDLFHYLFN
jgi:hypothetical protein